MARRLTIFFKVALFVYFSGIEANYAQESTFPLRNNPVLQNIHYPRVHSDNFRSQRSTDTLSLPFKDDFSNREYVPDQRLWIDRHVFRNNDMAIRPPGQGFVTFDGLDSIGRPYDNSSLSASGRADYLTSRPLRLGGFTTADSVILTFAYQPAGWCESPEPSDSLCLEFRSINGNWSKVWFANGSTVHPFRYAAVPVGDSQFLYDGMQMRWVNYGSLTGLVDCWHLDYVMLNAGRSLADTLINDIALVQTNATYLRPYRSMPLNQFLADTARFLNPTHGVSIVNNGTSANYERAYRVFEFNATSPVFTSPSLPALTLGTLSSSALIFQRFAVPAATGDSLSLLLEYSVQSVGDLLTRNDTLLENIKLWNEFAYDDGTAETGYGINVIAGSCANKFWLSRADTLRGVWIYFTQAAANASNELFVLKVWSQIQEGGRGSTEIFRSAIPYRPRYGDSIGHFQYFAINPPLVVQDSFYIGWQQETTGLLNIGLDRNDTLVRYNRWFNTQGIWEESSIAGSWMIRPVMGGPFRYPASTAPMESTGNGWVISPNPLTHDHPVVSIEGPEALEAVLLVDAAGRTLKQLRSGDPWPSPTNQDEGSKTMFRYSIPMNAIDKGLYSLILYGKGGVIHCTKVLIL
jgi:hypothetical protein